MKALVIVRRTIGLAGCSAPLMSPVAGLRPSPPPLLRYAEHPTSPIGECRRCLAAPRRRRLQARAAGGRCGEVKEEGWAQPVPGDTSGIGHLPPLARPGSD